VRRTLDYFASFLAFFAAFFSFGVDCGDFFFSLLLFCSLPMVRLLDARRAVRTIRAASIGRPGDRQPALQLPLPPNDVVHPDKGKWTRHRDPAESRADDGYTAGGCGIWTRIGADLNQDPEQWRARLGSNQRPLASEASTLSAELRARTGNLRASPTGSESAIVTGNTGDAESAADQAAAGARRQSDTTSVPRAPASGSVGSRLRR